VNDKYLNELERVLGRVRSRLLIAHQLEFKNCFGAVAGYVDGHIFVSCGKFGVALRLPTETLAELSKEKDVSRLQYFPNGHVKKEYAVIPKRIMDDGDRFRNLADKSIKYALSAAARVRCSSRSG
jgi:hypothetical protein